MMYFESLLLYIKLILRCLLESKTYSILCHRRGTFNDSINTFGDEVCEVYFHKPTGTIISTLFCRNSIEKEYKLSAINAFFTSQVDIWHLDNIFGKTYKSLRFL